MIDQDKCTIAAKQPKVRSSSYISLKDLMQVRIGASKAATLEQGLIEEANELITAVAHANDDDSFIKIIVELLDVIFYLEVALKKSSSRVKLLRKAVHEYTSKVVRAGHLEVKSSAPITHEWLYRITSEYGVLCTLTEPCPSESISCNECPFLKPVFIKAEE